VPDHHGVVERLGQRRIEVGPDVRVHDRHRRVVREPRLVRPRGRQRVVAVGTGQDPRDQRDLLPAQLVGIAAPIPSLVVRHHDRDHVLGKVDAVELLHAALAVRPPQVSESASGRSVTFFEFPDCRTHSADPCCGAIVIRVTPRVLPAGRCRRRGDPNTSTVRADMVASTLLATSSAPDMSFTRHP
jgi:hypothetical protein